MDAGLVPVKRLDLAKRRLSGAFDPPRRRRLAEALLEDALELCRSADFLSWWVVSDDNDVLRLAAQAGLSVVSDSGAGLNPALTVALERLADHGAASVTIVPCDVPLARAEDVEDVLETGATSDVVVVASARDGGTNALYLSPPGAIAPRFGRGSLEAHLAEAGDRRLRACVLSLPRLALDLDTSEDLATFCAWPGAGATHSGRLLAAFEKGA